MNQEKIMKRKMISSIVLFILALIALLVFVGLYIDETKKTQQSYNIQYMENIKSARDEITYYLDTKTDYDLHYNMLISDLGAARSLIFLLDNLTEQQKIINELHYCFVKYPEQMKSKLEDTKTALEDIADNLDKGYTEAYDIVQSINRMGT